MQKLGGTFTALITPFDDQDQLDEHGLRQNIRFQLDSGIDGIVVLGSTGETPCLSDHEKMRIIQISREETDNRAHLMVGTGSYSTQQTIKNTKQAKDLGADSVLIVTPYYNKPTQEGIYLHFQKIANEVNIPIMIYHIPSRCMTNISIETMIR
ncbi:MAG TPA: dihydrodipicolinate synthase family protein, partial [Waddliaceae bacterium]